MAEREGVIRSVVEGLNGRLFLGTQGGFWVDRYMSARPFGVSHLERWRRTLRRRARELARRGIPYVFYVVPDAHFVHREDLPPDFRPKADVPPGERFLDAVADVPNLTIVNPRRALESAKGLMEIYRKTDSHWSFYGGFVGYKVLAQALTALLPTSILRARDVAFEYRRTFGDLGVAVTPERQEDAPATVIAKNAYSVACVNEGFRRNGCLETYCADAADARIFVNRDSFYTFQADYVSRSYRHMLCVGTTTSFFLDEIDRWQPQAVVSELGERRLFMFESDHRRDGFEDLFRADFSSDRGRVVQKMLGLRDNQKPAEAFLEAERLAAMPDLDPDHAYAVAQVLLGAGDLERAAAFVAAALSSFPERPSYRSLAASIHLARGDVPSALAQAERALAPATHNGYHHQMYVTALINHHAPDEARRHLDATLPDIDDSGVLWYLYSHTCEAAGDRPAAREAILQALLLDQSDGNFRERALQLWQ